VFVRLVSDTCCGLNAKLQVVVTDSKNCGMIGMYVCTDLVVVCLWYCFRENPRMGAS
jgi:hypothetical protein